MPKPKKLQIKKTSSLVYLLKDRLLNVPCYVSDLDRYIDSLIDLINEELSKQQED